MNSLTNPPVEKVPKLTAHRLRDHLPWVLSLFLIGLVGKFLLLQRCENSVPYFDQWEDEAAHLYVPNFEHQLSMADFFRAHNEHRMFWTRIYNLGLLLANGQWDAQLQMVTNAVLHCAIVAGLAWMVAAWLGPRRWPFIWLPFLLILVLPFAWENTLWGLQSAFYFLILFGLLAIRLLACEEVGSGRWRLGVLVAFAGIFTLASGVLAAVAVAAMSAVQILRDRTAWKRQSAAIGICAALTIAGWLLKAEVPRHDVLQAHSAESFLISLGRYFAWPNEEWPWLALLNLFPLLLLGWFYVRSGGGRRPAEQMVLGLGIWVLLQSLAAAYARGQGGQGPAPRYRDICSFLFIANCLSIGLLCWFYCERLRFARACYAAFAIWGVAAGVGLSRLTTQACGDPLSFWIMCQHGRVQTTRAFMATGDEQAFHTDNRFAIPFPYVPMLTFLLRTPDIRNILPACVREPLKVVPEETGRRGFITNGWDLATPEQQTEISWGSYSPSGAKAGATLESLPIKKSALPYLEVPDRWEPRAEQYIARVDRPGYRKESSSKAAAARRKKLAQCVRPAPAHEFRMVAVDSSPTGWFAFKAPREVGRFSYWAMILLAAWKYILAAGVGCLIWGFCNRFTRTAAGCETQRSPTIGRQAVPESGTSPTHAVQAITSH